MMQRSVTVITRHSGIYFLKQIVKMKNTVNKMK